MGRGRSPLGWRTRDLLLVLGVTGFAALLVYVASPGARSPSSPSQVTAPAPTRAASGPMADAADEAAPGAVERGQAPSPSDVARPGAAPAAARAAAPATDPGAASEPERRAFPNAATAADESQGLRVTGRILERSGRPIPGVWIELRPMDRQGLAEPGDRVTKSQADGRYALTRLDARRYRLSTRETPLHASRSVLVQGGSDGVDVVLDRRRSLHIHGRITGAGDEALAGVRVEPLSDPRAGVTSDEGGRYALHFETTSALRSLVLRLRADGYRDRQDQIDLPKLPLNDLERDFQLVQSPGFSVTGWVRARRAEVPVGSRVRLLSRKLGVRKDAVTDAEGRFRIEEMEAGDDWQLSVHPRHGFADASRGPLRLEGPGDELEILLEPLAMGSVAGRMLGPDGSPLPGFEIELYSSSASGRSLRIVADDAGRYRADEVPSGRLQFRTRALPLLRVAGPSLDPGAREQVDLVLDVGELDLAGRVVGEGGRAVAGADVRLSWRHRAGGIESTSFRRTVSDPDGEFRFAQLGRGPHELEIRAEGYARARESHEVRAADQTLELRLRTEP